MSLEMAPLPRGRHRLSREEVEGSQRLRLLRAMCEVMAEKGYAATSVGDILRRAHVSRETFYALFGSKESCFMSAFDQAYGHILDATAAPGGDASPIERFSRVLADYLRALASDPVAARVFLVEVYAAGPSALERRHELQRGLVESVARLVAAATEEDRFAVEALLAGLVQMVTARLAVGDVEGLRKLHGPTVELARRLGLGTAPRRPVSDGPAATVGLVTQPAAWVGVGSPNVPETASPEVFERFKQGWECWNDRELDLMGEMYAEDGELDMSAVFTGMPQFKGRESMRRQWEELWETWEGLRMDPLEVLDVGPGRFVVDIRLWGRGKRSGVEVDQRLAFLYTVREADEKVVRCQLFPSVQSAVDSATDDG